MRKHLPVLNALAQIARLLERPNDLSVGLVLLGLKLSFPTGRSHFVANRSAQNPAP